MMAPFLETGGAGWIVAGLLGCGAEMLLPGVFLLPVGVAAVLTGIGIQWFELGPGADLLVFSALLITLVLLAWRLRRVQADNLNGPQAGLIGATCRSLGFSGQEGRVSLADGAWPARILSPSMDRAALEVGVALRVVELDGTTLVVRPLETGPAGEIL